MIIVIKNICKEKLSEIKVVFTEVWKKNQQISGSEVIVGKFISVSRYSATINPYTTGGGRFTSLTNFTAKLPAMHIMLKMLYWGHSSMFWTIKHLISLFSITSIYGNSLSLTKCNFNVFLLLNNLLKQDTAEKNVRHISWIYLKIFAFCLHKARGHGIIFQICFWMFKC